MKIIFSNGVELPIIMCYNNGQRFISGQTRNTRDIQLATDVIGIGELKALLSEPANLVTIGVTGDDGETEVLTDFIYPGEIKDKFDGYLWFVIGEVTETEKAIDELLIAMEV